MKRQKIRQWATDQILHEVAKTWHEVREIKRFLFVHQKKKPNQVCECIKIKKRSCWNSSEQENMTIKTGVQ